MVLSNVGDDGSGNDSTADAVDADHSDGAVDLMATQDQVGHSPAVMLEKFELFFLMRNSQLLL